MILVDASGLLAWIDDREGAHAWVAEAMSGIDGPFVISPFALAEVDHLLRTRRGHAQRVKLLGQVEIGAYELARFDAADLRIANRLVVKFHDLDISLADASICALAERRGIADLLTLDRRHFRILPGPGGRPFRILPADLP